MLHLSVLFSLFQCILYFSLNKCYYRYILNLKAYRSTTGDSLKELLNKKGNSIVPKKDPLYEEALRIFTDTGQISTGLLQRYLRIGFNRATQLVDAIKLQNNL